MSLSSFTSCFSFSLSPVSATHTQPASHSFLSWCYKGCALSCIGTQKSGSLTIISDGLFFSCCVVFLSPGENVQAWILNTLAGEKTVFPSTVCHLISSTEVKACFSFPNSLSHTSQSGRLIHVKQPHFYLKCARIRTFFMCLHL